MKKILLFITLLTLVLSMVLTAGAAEERHPHTAKGHCVCGGAAAGTGDHVCANLTSWTALSGEVRFGDLASGNYYLTENATVSGASAARNVGSTVKAESEDRYEATEQKNIVLCLNGYDLTLSDRLYIYQGSSLSVCDCSWDGQVFGGTVTGGTSVYGSVAYLYALSTVNIYGGNFTMKAGLSNTQGGLFVVAQDRGSVVGYRTNPDQESVLNLYNGNIYGGCSGKGGNINVMHCSRFNMYGGVLADGSATSAGGNIYTYETASAKLYGGAVTGGSPEVAMALKQDGTLVGSYKTVAEAASKGDYVRLMTDVTENATISGDLYLDLAGHDLSGLTVTGTLYGMDSTTDTYDGSQAGTLTCTGKVAVHHKTDKTGSIKRYLTVQENGSYSFHRFYMGITALTLKPDSVGVGYKATVAGDEAVKNSLSAYGYRLQLGDHKPVVSTMPGESFGGLQTVTLRVDNFLKTSNTNAVNTERAQMPIEASVIFTLKDGTQIESAQVSYSFRQVTEAANGQFTGYNLAQRNALQTLSAKYATLMTPWDISQFHHATGTGWASKNQTSFVKLLTDNNNCLPTGRYLLSGDVDLGSRLITIHAGQEVTICLNGHTITNDRRINNYGTLNICDCHVDGQEGAMIGTQASTYETDGKRGCYGPVMYAYYGSVTNLYGGTLKATNKADTAGVIAISHDGRDANTSKPAAVFNMYGGAITGGNSMRDGGLVAIWNGGTMNMYGGTLTGGTCAQYGGALMIDQNCTMNMYGGTIANNTSTGDVGGNVMLGWGGRMNIYGGTITGGTAVEGGGIYVEGDLYLQGNPQITGNGKQNVFVPYNRQIRSVDLEPDASVGITAHTRMLLSDRAVSVKGLVDDRGDSTFQVSNGSLFLATETLPIYGTTTGFTAGFGRRDISPTEDMMGLPLSGFGNDSARACTEVTDRLYATVIAVTDEQGQTVLLSTFDLQAPRDDIRELLQANISAATGVPVENIHLSATHTHSAPSISNNSLEMRVYKSYVVEQFTLAALDAMADRQAATMYTGSFETDNLNFTRHYSYVENGVTKYFGDNFGTQVINSTTKHVTANDPTAHLLKFDRAGQDILLVNWRAHPTMTGANGYTQVSSDFIGPLREKLEADTGMHFAYFQGAAGNQNLWSRITSENKSFNGRHTHIAHGQEMARQIENNLGVLKNIGTGTIKTDSYEFTAYVDHSADDRVEDARIVQNTYWGLATSAEKSALLKQYDFTSVYHAGAVVSKAGMGESKNFRLSVFAIGDQLAFYTAPGELWNSVSVEMEQHSPYKTTFTMGYCDGDAAYFPYAEALTYDSYETYYCRWVQPDAINNMMAYWKSALTELYNS